MKIGIVTFYNAHNYGAVWQAFALKKYLENTGNDIEIIQYNNSNISAMYPEELHLRLGKKNYIFPSLWKKSIEEYKRVKYSKEEWKVQYQRFEDFIKAYLCDNSTKQWEKQVYDKELIFFGSDQIWEKRITGEEKQVYFGDFETKAKKVSYAASCYSETTNISNYMIENLKKFEKISVREKKLAIRLKNILCRDIAIVADPVFLLDKKSYIALINERVYTEPYVLFYFVNEDTELKKISNYIKDILHKKVLEIHYYKTDNQSDVDKIYSAGPLEFLQLFYYASEIYTNSFHGTAFSIIFHKDFYSLSYNIRVKNLLEIIDLECRNIKSYMEWIQIVKSKTMIDYKKVDYLKSHYIQTSIDFIHSVLGQ